MEKKCKIIMLPTKDKTDIFKVDSGLIYNHRAGTPVWKDQFQHLYLTTDDEIKEGDWYSEAIMGSYMIHQMTEKSLIGWNKDANHKDNLKRRCRKIIATTDINLNREKVYRISKKGETLHQDVRGTYEWKCNSNPISILSDSFVEIYCDKDGVDEVNVEYETVTHNKSVIGLAPMFTTLEVKIDSNNCIVTNFPKDSWNKEEVMDLLMTALFEPSPYNVSEASEWIKEIL